MHCSSIVVALAALAWGQDPPREWTVEADVARAAAAAASVALPEMSVSLSYDRLGADRVRTADLKTRWDVEPNWEGTVSLDRLDLDPLSGWSLAFEAGLVRLQAGRHRGSADPVSFPIPNIKSELRPGIATLHWDVRLMELSVDARVLRADIADVLTMEVYGGAGYYRMDVDASSAVFGLAVAPDTLVPGLIRGIDRSLSGWTLQASVRLSARVWDNLEIAVEVGNRFRLGEVRGDQTVLGLSVRWTF